MKLRKLLTRLFHHIGTCRRRQFFLILGLTLVSSLAEVVSLGAVVPFIGVLTQPEKVFQHPSLFKIREIFHINSAAELVLPLTILFAAVALVAGTLRLLLLWGSTRLANAIGADIGIDVYRRTLYQPYRVHVARSSSEIISGITQKVSATTEVLTAIMGVVTSTILFMAILSGLLVINPTVAVTSLLSFGVSYVVIAWQTRARLIANGRCVAAERTQVVKALQEGLGAIRDVLLDGSQSVYCSVYSKAVMKLRRAGAENTYLNQAPRYFMETLGMILIAVLAYVLSSQKGGVAAALPVLGALAIGAQRLLPLLQLMYGNWSNVISNQASLHDVLDLLDQPLPAQALQELVPPLAFKNEIRFDNVKFSYNGANPWVLDGINLTIPKGARVGFVGSTGSGKSTTLDLLMLLLEPSQGKILVDGQSVVGPLSRAWQNTIAHVPQNIYLADASVAENIAFGVPPKLIDMDRVRRAAEQSQIVDFIESHPDGYNAFVGERGIRLSGGQRQRIGIARALYKQASVLVFDEATSALDSLTENAVMSAIENLNRDLTIIMVAHRITTLKNCDTLIKLEHGKIVAQCSYDDFIGGVELHLTTTALRS